MIIIIIMLNSYQQYHQMIQVHIIFIILIHLLIDSEQLICVYITLSEAKGFNIFRKFMSEIREKDQLQFIYQGIH